MAFCLAGREAHGEPTGFTSYTRPSQASPAPAEDWKEEALEESIPHALDTQVSIRASADQDQDGRRNQLLVLSGQGSLLRTPLQGQAVFQRYPERQWQLQDGSLAVEGDRQRLRLGYQYANLWGFAGQSQRLRVLELNVRSAGAPWWTDGGYQGGAPLDLRLPGAIAYFPEKTAWQTALVVGDQPTLLASTSVAREIEQTVTGAQGVLLSKHLNVRLAGFRFGNRLPAGSPGLISGHSVYMGGASLRLPRTTLGLDYGLSQAQRTDSPGARDHQWRGQLDLDLGALKVIATRQRVGPAFMSFGSPTAYQDFEGTEIAPRLNVSRFLQLHGGYLWSRDNVKRDPSVRTRHTKLMRAGADFTVRSWRSRLAWQDEHELGGTRRRQYRAGSNWSLRRTNLDAEGAYQVASLQGVPASLDRSLRVGIFHSFVSGGYVSLSEQARKSEVLSPARSEHVSLSHALSLSRYNFDEFLNWILDASLESSRHGQGASARHQASGSLALNFQLNLDQRIRLIGRIKNYDVRVKRLGEWNVGTEWSVTFRLRALRKAGRLSGFVYLDSNRNGRRDPGEPPAPGVTLIMGDGREVRSSWAGRFELDRVAPGFASISLLEDDLPEAYVAEGVLFKAKIAEFGTSRVEIPVYPARRGPAATP